VRVLIRNDLQGRNRIWNNWILQHSNTILSLHIINKLHIQLQAQFIYVKSGPMII